MKKKTVKKTKRKAPKKYRRSDFPSLDYYQGYFDCFRNIRASVAELYDRAKNYSVINLPDEILNTTNDARICELRMYEYLKHKYGDRFSIDSFGEVTIDKK